MKASHPQLSSHLRAITSDLRSVDHGLKTGLEPEPTALQEFRQSLDNVRLTAWTVSELMNARQADRHPETVFSFLASERLRRLSQMIKDLSADMDEQELTWESSGIQGLFESVNMLQARLGKMVERHRARFQKVSDKA